VLAVRKAPTKKKTVSRYDGTMVASSQNINNEDAVDAGSIREAREAGKGKAVSP